MLYTSQSAVGGETVETVTAVRSGVGAIGMTGRGATCPIPARVSSLYGVVPARAVVVVFPRKQTIHYSLAAS